jgi:hypothetical protein
VDLDFMKNGIQATQKTASTPHNFRRASVVLMTLLIICTSCSIKILKPGEKHNAVSESFGHFEGGVLFTDVVSGLDIMWDASVQQNGPYKENLAYIVAEGLLVAPNTANTTNTSLINALPLCTINNELFVFHNGRNLKVLAIIHTHPAGIPEHTPRSDFQYCYLGIHNFVMSRFDLYEGYKTQNGNEISVRVGQRRSYEKLPIPAQSQIALRN